LEVLLSRLCLCEGEFLVHGRLAALLLLLLLLQLLSSADDAGIAVFVRAEHSVFLPPVRSSLGLSGPAILVVFNATCLMQNKIMEQAAATCKALAPKITRINADFY
jgi:hypothetical protein